MPPTPNPRLGNLSAVLAFLGSWLLVVVTSGLSFHKRNFQPHQMYGVVTTYIHLPGEPQEETVWPPPAPISRSDPLHPPTQADSCSSVHTKNFPKGLDPVWVSRRHIHKWQLSHSGSEDVTCALIIHPTQGSESGERALGAVIKCAQCKKRSVRFRQRLLMANSVRTSYFIRRRKP